MPSVAIYGDSGMDKTMIMKRFRDEHPPSFNPLTGTLKTPVLAMEMTSRPGERRFYAELLTLLGAPQRPRADIAQMEQAALRIMEAIGVQVLVIDEVHNILAGSYREQRIVLNTLRFLSNRLNISRVCSGVNEARKAISGDAQLARRFEQFTLDRWATNEQLETLVVSILRNTPLRRASVLTPKSLRRMLQITEGITANIFHMLNSLAIEAIENGSGRITDDAVENWEPEFDTEEAFALRTTNLHLSGDQENRLARLFAIEPATVHRMTFTNVAEPVQRLIASRQMQVRPNCSPDSQEPAPILRSQLLGWRITCPLCGDLLRDVSRSELPSPFRQYHRAASSWRKTARR